MGDFSPSTYFWFFIVSCKCCFNSVVLTLEFAQLREQNLGSRFLSRSICLIILWNSLWQCSHTAVHSTNDWLRSLIRCQVSCDFARPNSILRRFAAIRFSLTNIHTTYCYAISKFIMGSMMQTIHFYNGSISDSNRYRWRAEPEFYHWTNDP